MLYGPASFLAKVAYPVLARMDVEGKEGVLPKGPLIVVCNHVSNADPCVLSGVLLPRRFHYFAKRGVFVNPLVAAILTDVNVHPVNRDQADLSVLRTCLDLLARDQAIMLFPEGRRSTGGGMIKAQPGVAYIAAKSQAPILPVAIWGTEAIKGYWRIFLPLCSIKVRIGQPFTPPVLEGRLSRPILENMTGSIMGRVATLLPPEYRGFYSLEQAEVRG